ncbi:MAG TPA: hypothetical protein VK472_01905 [Allosphingosinicella sp.]|nr:hypothetical protein [Allosphingosinicella sp.]
MAPRGNRRAFALALNLVFPAGAALASAPSPAPAADSGATIVELVGVLAWPVAALIIAALFRRPLSALVTALGGRITKLSLFKVELELVPAEAATAPLLDEIRNAAIGAQIQDSGGMLLRHVQEGSPAHFAVVNLGAGREWLTSRLYIAAVMLERMRGVRAFVFLEDSPPVNRRFVALASVRQVRWALAQSYPWLEGAWLQAGGTIAPDLQAQNRQAALVKSDTGALENSLAQRVAGRFIQSLQRAAQPEPVAGPPGALQPPPPPPAAPAPPAPAGEWVTFERGVSERASWIGRGALEALLPPECFESWTFAMPDASRGRRTRAVLRRSGEFVAIVEQDMRFSKLVDRRALLEQMAASLSDEPDS